MGDSLGSPDGVNVIQNTNRHGRGNGDSANVAVGPPPVAATPLSGSWSSVDWAQYESEELRARQLQVRAEPGLLTHTCWGVFATCVLVPLCN